MRNTELTGIFRHRASSVVPYGRGCIAMNRGCPGPDPPPAGGSFLFFFSDPPVVAAMSFFKSIVRTRRASLGRVALFSRHAARMGSHVMPSLLRHHPDTHVARSGAGSAGGDIRRRGGLARERASPRGSGFGRSQDIQLSSRTSYSALRSLRRQLLCGSGDLRGRDRGGHATIASSQGFLLSLSARLHFSITESMISTSFCTAMR